MSSVLLAHSYFLRYDPKEWSQMKPYPPLGTLYAASVMQNAGFDVTFFDPMFSEHEEEIVPFLTRVRPDYVVFFEDNFNYLSKMCLTRMREACFRMAGEVKKFGCIVIAQGSDPIDHLEEYFSHNIDHVIYGEGEITLIELLQSLSSGNDDLAKIHGIAYKNLNRIQVNPKRQPIRDLDSIPFPAWDLVDIDRYRSTWEKKHWLFSLNLVTTRGCPFHCNWCAKPIYGQIYNSRSPKNVVEEIKTLRSKFHVDHIWFADDIFGLKPGWISEYSRLVNDEHMVTPFTCQSRVDLLLQEHTIDDLTRAGAQTVWVGAESGSQKILDAMEKGTSVKQIYQATKLLKLKKINVAFFLQFGYPGEQDDDIQKTLRMVRECKPDDIGISVSYPLPGTKFYESVKSSLAQKQNWITSDDLDLMYVGTYHPDFYRALHAAVHREFRIRKAFDALIHFQFNKKNLRQLFLIGRNLFLFFVAKRKMKRCKKKKTSRTIPVTPVLE